MLRTIESVLMDIGEREFMHRYGGTYIAVKRQSWPHQKPFLVETLDGGELEGAVIRLNGDQATARSASFSIDSNVEIDVEYPQLGFIQHGSYAAYTYRGPGRVYKRGLDPNLIRFVSKNEVRLDNSLSRDVLYNIYKCNSFATVAEGYRKIQEGYLGYVINKEFALAKHRSIKDAPVLMWHSKIIGVMPAPNILEVNKNFDFAEELVQDLGIEVDYS